MGGHPFGAMWIDLPEGATLALYTDHLIEARGQDIEVGLAAVFAELSRSTGQLEETADRLVENLLLGPPTDDTVFALARVRRSTPRHP
ncbi:SpoIIE family protein phosphatase [Streptomyces sp. ISL-10]|nr:SpoIIE family protein phosphatase [Streptomyces sp. ISL-10]